MNIDALTITPSARARMRHLVDTHGATALGIRLSVTTRGCNGLSYVMDFTDTSDKGEMVEVNGVNLVIDDSALPYIEGTEVDFIEDKLGAMFTFKHPEEKGRCGCGESFNL